jgi:hypothetical protein
VAEAHRVSEYLIRAEQALADLEGEAAGLREGDGAADRAWSVDVGQAAEAPGFDAPAPGEGDGRVEAIRRDLGALRRGGAEVGGR